MRKLTFFKTHSHDLTRVHGLALAFEDDLGSASEAGARGEVAPRRRVLGLCGASAASSATLLLLLLLRCPYSVATAAASSRRRRSALFLLLPSSVGSFLLVLAASGRRRCAMLVVDGVGLKVEAALAQEVVVELLEDFLLRLFRAVGGERRRRRRRRSRAMSSAHILLV
jgi:hypothetical protein